VYGILRQRIYNPFFGRHVYEVLIRGREKQSNLKLPNLQTVRKFQTDIVSNSIFFIALRWKILM
jgi:hypothetical protein